MTAPNSRPEGTGFASSDREELGVLRTRMSGVERTLQDISGAVQALAGKFDKKSEIPWQALGVILAFGGLIGGALYFPIRETTSDLKQASITVNGTINTLALAMHKGNSDLSERANNAIFNLSEKVSKEFVTVRELDARTVRSQTDLSRLREDVKTLDMQQVPRVEQAERFRSFELQFANLQRQLDDIKKAFGDTYSLRDALQEMKREMDRLREKRPL